MVVKFRIFKRAETLGLASLVASLFDKFDIFDNPRLVCKYVAVVYSGITSDSDLRRQVAGLLMNAMDQKLENIFFNPIQVSNLKCIQRIGIQQKKISDFSEAKWNAYTVKTNGKRFTTGS